MDDYYQYAVEMMKPQKLERVQLTPYFAFREPEKHKWAARLAWSLLSKLKALKVKQETITTITYSSTDARTITNKIHRAILEMFERGLRREDVVLVIGGIDFDELVSIQVDYQHMEFPLSEVRFARESHGQYERMTYKGLIVQVIPSMKGFALIPRVVIEREVTVK